MSLLVLFSSCSVVCLLLLLFFILLFSICWLLCFCFLHILLFGVWCLFVFCCFLHVLLFTVFVVVVVFFISCCLIFFLFCKCSVVCCFRCVCLCWLLPLSPSLQAVAPSVAMTSEVLQVSLKTHNTHGHTLTDSLTNKPKKDSPRPPLHSDPRLVLGPKCPPEWPRTCPSIIVHSREVSI